MHIPLLWNPLGWAVLGVAGYLIYRAGKNAGRQEGQKKAEQN